MRLDKALVIDIEATCWEKAPPEGERSEIIEIGLCELDLKTGAIDAKESLLVRPEGSRVSDFCERLTGLTQERADAGLPFEEACRRLRAERFSERRVWASFGNYDRRLFERQCADRAVAYPFSDEHWDVRLLAAAALGLRHGAGMVRTMEALGLEPVGEHHRAADDAWNAARMLALLLASCRDGMAATAAPETGQSSNGVTSGATRPSASRSAAS